MKIKGKTEKKNRICKDGGTTFKGATYIQWDYKEKS